jgi:hypothetical protein
MRIVVRPSNKAATLHESFLSDLPVSVAGNVARITAIKPTKNAIINLNPVEVIIPLEQIERIEIFAEDK